MRLARFLKSSVGCPPRSRYVPVLRPGHRDRHPRLYTEWTVGRPVRPWLRLHTADLKVQQPKPHVHVRVHPFARSLFSPRLRDEQRASATRKVSASRAWVASQVQNWRLGANAQHATRESPQFPAPTAPPVGTNGLGESARVMPPDR